MNVPIIIIVITGILFLIILIWSININRQIIKKAQDLFSLFKTKEIESLKTSLEYSAKQEARASLENWKIEFETRIRQDAINRSQAVILGKVTEHAIPFRTDFPYNPKDLRFIGSPIDMVVFDGCDEDKDEISVYFLEIKTGNSSLNKKQKLIKEALIAKRVFWRELRV